ncbi:MAG: SRPBCC family protein [Acetobacteraceae bacterium]|nr:SRPBCC family protein [Acetobacteraceae bacterium]
MKRTSAADSVFIPASPERVLAALLVVDRYHLWWPAALRVRVVSPPPHGLGSVVEIRALESRLRCRIAAVEPPSRLAVEYVAGPHRGHGSWKLEP